MDARILANKFAGPDNAILGSQSIRIAVCAPVTNSELA